MVIRGNLLPLGVIGGALVGLRGVYPGWLIDDTIKGRYGKQAQRGVVMMIMVVVMISW